MQTRAARTTSREAGHRPRVGLILLLIAIAITTIGAGQGATQVTPAPPNIVLINLDDADWDLLSEPNLVDFFPNIKLHLADRGLRLTNLHVTNPVCGPSRGSLFRGQYPHNSGIRRNEGGWNTFYDRGFTDSEIGMWMGDAGYTTGLVGKYCHTGFPQAARNGAYVPPGWDTFHSSHGDRYFRVWRNLDGERSFGPDFPEGYRTDLETESATDFVDRTAGAPFFLYLAPFAPHTTTDTNGIVAPRHRSLYQDVAIPPADDFNEVDMADKSSQFQALPTGTPPMVEEWTELYRDRLRAMTAVDEMIGAVFDRLEAQGILDQTYVILTSDNGYTIGHHRDTHKRSHWDRNTRVPFLIRGPGIEAGSADHLLSHIDITATILELASAPAPHFLDGRSFAPLLDNPATIDEEDWQSAVLIEHQGSKRVSGVDLDLRYQAVRRHDDIYVEFENGDREYYDLSVDPFQLENSFSELSPTALAELVAELNRLRACAGASCHGGQGVDPIDTSMDLDTDALLTNGSLSVTGSALDDIGVAGVDVVVRHVRTGLYWNGEQWTAQYAGVPATLEAPGSTSTTWSLTVDGLESGEHWLSARAWDVTGNEDPVIPTAFVDRRPDIEGPVGHIDTPTPGQTIVGPNITITGTATDNEAIDRTELVIRNQTTNTWWNGTTWQPTYTRVTTTQTGPPHNTTWTYTYPTPPQPANIYTGLWTWDRHGNRTQPQPPTAATHYTTSDGSDIEGPVGHIDTPTPGQTIVGPNITITGTATDNEAIDRTELVIRNQTTNTWWNGTTWQPTYTRVTTTQTGPPHNTTWTYTYPTPPQPANIYTGLWTWDRHGNRTQPQPPTAATHYTTSDG